MAARNNKGQFAPGNQEWRKRKRNGPQQTEEMSNLQAVIDANVSRAAVDAAWKRIATALEHGGRGWMDAFKLYLERRYGKPSQHIDADLDVTETLVRVVYDNDGD
jgi:hypothetical protein